MANRLTISLMLALMLVPRALPAQSRLVPVRPDPGHTRLAFSAVYGLRYTRVEERTIALPDGRAQGRFETEFGSGIGASALAEVVAAGPLRGIAALTLISRGGDTVERSAADGSSAVVPSSSVLLATVGIALRLTEPSPALQEKLLYTAIRAGPTYAVELSHSVAGRADERRAMSSWGLGVGIEAEAPIGRAATFQVGFEDHILLPNRAELARRLNEDFARAGLDAQAVVEAPAAHLLLLKVGFALTFR